MLSKIRYTFLDIYRLLDEYHSLIHQGVQSSSIGGKINNNLWNILIQYYFTVNEKKNVILSNDFVLFWLFGRQFLSWMLFSQSFGRWNCRLSSGVFYPTWESFCRTWEFALSFEGNAYLIHRGIMLSFHQLRLSNLVFSIATYGAKCWVLKNVDKRKNCVCLSSLSSK